MFMAEIVSNILQLQQPKFTYWLEQGSSEWNLVWNYGSVIVSSVYGGTENPQPIIEFVFKRLMADAGEDSKSLHFCDTKW